MFGSFDRLVGLLAVNNNNNVHLSCAHRHPERPVSLAQLKPRGSTTFGREGAWRVQSFPHNHIKVVTHMNAELRQLRSDFGELNMA